MLRRRGGTPGRRKPSDQWLRVTNEDGALRSYIDLTGSQEFVCGVAGSGESRVCN